MSSQNELPEPTLNLETLQPSLSTFAAPIPTYRQDSSTTIRSPAPQYSADDPWGASTRQVAAPPNMSGFDALGTRGAGFGTTPSGSALTGTGLSTDWWKRQRNVNVTIQGQQGFILNRYTVYQISTDVNNLYPAFFPRFLTFRLQGGPSVIRRYSEFVFLWDCLYRRYPFRLFPALPPKRIGRAFTLFFAQLLKRFNSLISR